ncbi:YqiA/YcfP family alpha/beta fold hydrolase [Psychrobacter lutiphocae]|uniref:YqiA/YcfP family alpha/beta fold hydrolase n=1 Tax=Psychrobacter lutiphocae TaxID=540500 RepID=UPI0003699681|nr:YqiA/YcfP family alpha/beta fold hydrolase [Psychrobacter lutiphocae]
MKIIYVHGLDSSARSMKGLLLERYCKHHHPEIQVLRPDLNQPPAEAFASLSSLVQQQQQADSTVVLMGSSLGGYFSTLVSNETGCPAYLLNPSTQPYISLQRFIDDLQLTPDQLQPETVVYKTTGGWEIQLKDLNWFAAHQLTSVKYPNKVAALIKEGDELLDPQIATQFYRGEQATVTLQPGGDHRLTDFNQQLPLIMEQIKTLIV